MIGEAHGHLGKAGEAHIDDKGTKEDPSQELDQLEEENEERVNSLSGKIFLPGCFLSFRACAYMT
jgi:hypothetical protein